MSNKTLRYIHTFALNVFASYIISAHTEQELIQMWRQANRVLLLGAGSNVLFLENYDGTIILNRILGINVREDNYAWYLHVGAGEIWNDLVIFCIKNNIPGLENLALIPGYVGSAPIHNIGAYGLELQQICEYVDIIILDDNHEHYEKRRLNNKDCKFGYRDSIFKHLYRKNCAIVAVGIKLKKAWQPSLNYIDLNPLQIKSSTIIPSQIYHFICAIRKKKLPITGNAGSFFKNPVLSAKTAELFIKKYPNAPKYPQQNGRLKLSAGWLIEQCNLKGYQIGGAAVYDKQALVIINNGKATSKDITLLASFVRKQVSNKFNIWLEPEVRFIASHGEVNAMEILY